MILAQTPESWTDPEPMPWLEVLGVFVGMPALLFLLIVVAVLAPSMVKGGGYRPGLSWWAAPEWFGTRPEETRPTPGRGELEAGQPAESGESGESGESADEERLVTGGVGARW